MEFGIVIKKATAALSFKIRVSLTVKNRLQKNFHALQEQNLFNLITFQQPYVTK